MELILGGTEPAGPKVPKVPKVILLYPTGSDRAQNGTRNGPKSDPQVEPNGDQKLPRKWLPIGAKTGARMEPEMVPKVVQEWSRHGPVWGNLLAHWDRRRPAGPLALRV